VLGLVVDAHELGHRVRMQAWQRERGAFERLGRATQRRFAGRYVAVCMKTVNVHDAKTGLSALLAEIEKSGTRIVISRNGKPIEDLVPHRREVSMVADKKLGAIKVKYDPTEEASETDWPADVR